MTGRWRAGRRTVDELAVLRIPSPTSRCGWRSPSHAELLLLHRGRTSLREDMLSLGWVSLSLPDSDERHEADAAGDACGSSEQSRGY